MKVRILESGFVTFLIIQTGFLSGLIVIYRCMDCGVSSAGCDSVCEFVKEDVRISPLACSTSLPLYNIPPNFVSCTVRHVCGLVSESAARYELRNDALRSIARVRDLSEVDILALMEYVASKNGSLSVEHESALKNDVLNLLVRQDSIPQGLADMLIEMVEVKDHPPEILDYCIQHLGTLYKEGKDEETLCRIHSALVEIARDIHMPYAGTALYALAARRSRTSLECDELRCLTIVALDSKADSLVRISALQLSGEMGYREALPIARDILNETCRDSVLSIVAVGTLGLLGDEFDLPLLEVLSARGGLRLKTPIDAAINRIRKRKAQ